MKKKAFTALLVGIGLSSLMIGKALASNSTTNNGIAVSPAIEQIALKQNQTNVSFNINVTNGTSSPITLQVLTDDFTALNNSGSVAFLSPGSVDNSHGLAHWINPGLTQIALPANGSKTVPIAITNVTSLAPGGHYGSIIYRVIPDVSKHQGNQFTTNEEVSTLIFLTTYSGGTHAIRLDQPHLGSIALSMPSTVNLVFTNTGNTQIAPRGLVTVFDGSKEIARGVINVESGLVLPSTDRLYEVALKYEKKVIYPGSYKIKIAYQASENSALLTYNKSFLYISKAVFFASIIVVILLVVLVIRLLGPKRSRRTGKVIPVTFIDSE